MDAAADSRGGGRLRRAGVSAAFGVAAKGIQLVTLVVTVPLLYGHLGPERYGLWGALTAINALLAFADFGLGNGLTTLLAQALGRDDRDGARRLVGGAMLATLWLGGALLLLAAISLPLLPWAWLLGVAGSAAAGEAPGAIAVAAVALALAVPTGLAARIRLGLQQGHLAALWEGAGQAVALGVVVLGIALGWSVPALLAAALGPPVAVQAVHLVVLLWRHQPWLRPRRGELQRMAAGPVLRSGLLFLVIQIATAVTYSFDAMFCAHLHGAAAAGELTAVQRLFVVPTVLFALALTPLWPAYGEALARGDLAWVRRTWRRSMWTAGAAGVALVALTPLLIPTVLQRWIGPAFAIDLPVLLACAASVAAMTLAHATSMLANGAGLLVTQAWCGLALLIATLIAKPLLGSLLGPAGLPLATAVTTLAAFAVPLALANRRRLTLPSAIASR